MSDLEAIEARVFARNLVGRVPPPEIVDRYKAAQRALGTDCPTQRDAALLEFARRHPWSVAYLDAACALREPRGLLRTKILIMTAILEASPEYADEFLPRATAPLPLLARLAGLGLLAIARAGVGLLVYPVAARR